MLLQRARPTVRLWHLFVAAQFVDFLWDACILAGVEHVRIIPGFTPSNDLDLWDMPYTHSLAATVGWSLLAFVAWRMARKDPTRTGDAAIVALVVASHFVLDLLVHVNDLPLLAGQGPKLGLGLWRNRTLALLVETGLFGAAAFVWWRPRMGTKGAPAALRALLVLTALAAVSFFIPTPPTPVAMAISALFTYVACTFVAARIERSAA